MRVFVARVRPRRVMAALAAMAICMVVFVNRPSSTARAAMGSEPTPKTIYLTFDDGPSANSMRLLDLLEEKGVKATFFVTGYRCEGADEILARIVADGHSIGLHTNSHIYSEIYGSMEAYLADLEAVEQLVYEDTGVHSQLYRFPGGSANSNCPKWMRKKITQELTARGYVWYDWNVVSGDQTATVYPAETLFNNVVTGAKGRDPLLILFHDTPLCKTTADAVELLIDSYTAQGWQFEAIVPGTPPIQFYSS